MNYRTSDETRRFAQNILSGRRVEDFEEGEVSTKGDHSLFSGPKPDIRYCTLLEDEAEQLASWASALMKETGLSSDTICIVYDDRCADAIRAELLKKDLPFYPLRPHEEDPGATEPGVRIGTIRRIKGLEFRAVAVACASSDEPLTCSDDADLQDLADRYVAFTRAREYLLVTLPQPAGEG